MHLLVDERIPTSRRWRPPFTSSVRVGCVSRFPQLIREFKVELDACAASGVVRTGDFPRLVSGEEEEVRVGKMMSVAPSGGRMQSAVGAGRMQSAAGVGRVQLAAPPGVPAAGVAGGGSSVGSGATGSGIDSGAPISTAKAPLRGAGTAKAVNRWRMGKKMRRTGKDSGGAYLDDQPGAGAAAQDGGVRSRGSNDDSNPLKGARCMSCNQYCYLAMVTCDVCGLWAGRPEQQVRV
jgi:hypothetical protein